MDRPPPRAAGFVNTDKQRLRSSLLCAQRNRAGRFPHDPLQRTRSPAVAAFMDLEQHQVIETRPGNHIPLAPSVCEPAADLFRFDLTRLALVIRIVVVVPQRESAHHVQFLAVTQVRRMVRPLELPAQEPVLTR